MAIREYGASLSVIIPNPQGSQTLAAEIQNWSISREELASYLLFFDRVSYFSGLKRTHLISAGEQFALQLPQDPALATPGLILPFFAAYPDESIQQAILAKIAEGFDNAPDDFWVCHPSILAPSNQISHPFFPSISASFLDGVVCPRGDVYLDDVIKFRERRAPERQAFFEALLEVSEGISVDGRLISFDVPVERVKIALDDLNRTILERWAEGVKKSFNFGIKLNEKSLIPLVAAVAGLQYLDNATFSVLSALCGTIQISVVLTPQIAERDEFTKAMSFAWLADREFGS